MLPAAGKFSPVCNPACLCSVLICFAGQRVCVSLSLSNVSYKPVNSHRMSSFQLTSPARRKKSQGKQTARPKNPR